jgi:ABC-type glycerol-3-phosphate transport system substrate-binding protein
MTSPEGEKYYGWWKVTAVDPPRTFAFEDGFASDDTFTPLEDIWRGRVARIDELIALETPTPTNQE